VASVGRVVTEASGETTPTFAVVGHPNKGKSSLTATLAQDARVPIAAEPGTTTVATRFPMRVDGETLYVLVDTPGFQRARPALAWLEAEAARCEATAADRPGLIARFCADTEVRERFPDEVALLTPLVEGAGILYVVDGSVPYGPEYEAEMEILRWTGRPSMAVINPIASSEHVEAWRVALGQYFRVVRVLDAVSAPFGQRLDLLRAFGELEETWRAPLARAVEVLGSDRARRVAAAADEIAQLLVEALALHVDVRVGRNQDVEALKPELAERYRTALRELEQRARRRVERLYAFDALRVEEPESAVDETEQALLEEDLFAEETWLVFGLRKRDLAAAGGAAGAATGGTLDVALGGSSLLAGAAVGAVVGAVLGWLGSDRLADTELLRQPLGGQLLRYGPARGIQLAFVLLGRARLHHARLSERTHARRDALSLAADDEGEMGRARIEPLDAGTARRLMQALRSARQAESGADVRERVEALLEADLERA
jgi:hypothetical protein